MFPIVSGGASSAPHEVVLFDRCDGRQRIANQNDAEAVFQRRAKDTGSARGGFFYRRSALEEYVIDNSTTTGALPSRGGDRRRPASRLLRVHPHVRDHRPRAAEADTASRQEPPVSHSERGLRATARTVGLPRGEPRTWRLTNMRRIVTMTSPRRGRFGTETGRDLPAANGQRV
jgi:hypothetical protein